MLPRLRHKCSGLCILLVAGQLLCLGAGHAASRLDILPSYAEAPLQGWEEHRFKGSSHYVWVPDQALSYLSAHSKASASGLVRTITIDLKKTPYLHWSWRLQYGVYHGDETSKQGDDFPARIYLIWREGPFFWQKRALNYVWSNAQDAGKIWPNPYSDRSVMWSVTGDVRRHVWRHEVRDVSADLARLGFSVRRLQAVALMSDSDNTGNETQADFAAVFFTDQP